jgi:transposase InsO family protein
VGSKILRWTRPGAVWAMDFTFAPRPIERRFRRLLLVRDLASGRILLALACPGEGAACAVAALRALFLRWGAPLVLKSDNGSAFTSQEMEDLLREFGVTALLSPARTPRYNGGCEAGIGSLKVRVQHRAAWAGRPGDGTLDDVEWARCETNELGRPRGRWRPTPDEAFAARRPIVESERRNFLEQVDRRLDDEADRGVLRADGRLGRARLAVATRAAVARVLVESGLLEIKTRPIPQPISSPIRAAFG